MKNTFRKIGLIIFTILFLICGLMLVLQPAISEKNNLPQAAATTTTLTLAADKTDLVPGDTFTLTATFTSTRTTNDWNSFSVLLGPLAGDGKTFDANVCQYLTVKSKRFSLSSLDYTNTTTDKFKAGTGLLISATNNFEEPLQADTPVVFTVVIAVSADITGVSNFDFGMNPISKNTVTYDVASPSDKADSGALACNTISFKLAAPSDDATLSEVKVGHGTASTALTVADAMSYTGSNSDYTNFKVQATANDKGATIKMGASPNPTKVVTSGTAETVPLSGGTTTIYIDVTAEDGVATKSYTIVYTSAYVRIGSLSYSSNTPTTGTTKNGLAPSFAKDTFNYTVNVPSDATTVTLTPTVSNGYDIKSSIAVATSGCTAATSVNSGSALSVTDVSSGDTLTLTATAADGTTTQAYDLTFQVFSVDTSITSFTMADGDGTVHNSSTNPSYDYYFSLPYASTTKDYKGTFNITKSNSNATLKVGSANYSATTRYGEGSYTVTVTAEAGNSKSYTVFVKSDVVPAKFDSLKYSVTNLAGYTDVFTSAEYDDGTKTFTKKYNVTDITASPARFYIGGTATAGATVTNTGLTKNSQSSSEEYDYYANLSIGTNTFTLKATSSSGTTIYTFVINYVEEKNTITDISVSGTNVENITFDPTTTSYTVEVPYTTSSVDFTLKTDGVYTYVYKNNDSGKVSGSSKTHTTTVGSLKAGTPTTVNFYAKADEGKGAKGTEYTFTVTRKLADTDATLKSLVVKIGGVEQTLSPTFSPAQTTYQVKAESGSLLVSITAEANSEYATVSIPADKTYVLGYNADQAISVTVRAQSGATETYTVTITTNPRTLDSNYEISDLKITGSNSAEYFAGSSANMAYGNQTPITVPYLVNNVNVSATRVLASSIVNINGTAGTSRNVNLNVGSNTITVYAQAEDGTNSDGANKYVFTVIREQAAAFTSLKFSTESPSSYADILADLSGTTFTKTINISEFAGSSQWRVYIGGSVTPSDSTVTSDSKLTAAMAAGSSETYNYYADLVLGENRFTITVAKAATDSKTYTFVLNLVEGKNTITDISITNAGNKVDDSFTFNATQVVYEIEVPWSLTSVDLAVTADGNYTKVLTKPNASTLEHDPATYIHTMTRSLEVGENVITFYAVADEGRGANGQDYTLKITRKAAETDATIKTLTVTINGEPVQLSPEFRPEQLTYNIQDTSDSLLVFIEAEANGRYAVVTGAGEHNLGEISVDTVKVITISVTAEDGTTQEYKIKISKAPVPLDSNYEIASLTIVGNDGVTYFDSTASGLAYGEQSTITVPFTVERVTVTATLASSKSILFGDGLHELTVVGEDGNKIKVYAQAEDGANSDSANSYLFTIVREKPAEHAWLVDLQVNDVTVKDFASQTYEYTVREANTTEFVKMRAVAEDANAKVSISLGGNDVSSNFGTVYAGLVPLGEKGKSITVIITVSLDGKTEYYTVRIIRSADKPVLSSLWVGGYDVYDSKGNVIDGNDEDVVGSMINFYVELETSNVNSLLIKATTNDVTAELLLPGDNGSLNISDLLKDDGTLDSAKIAIVAADAVDSSDVAIYYVHFILLTSSTNAEINIKEITAFNEQYSNTNPSIVYGIYSVPYTLPMLTIDVKPETREGLASGTYQIYYNGALKNDNGTEVSNSKLNYGTNYVTITVTSSDKRVTKTIVVLVEREEVRLEKVSIDEIEAFEKDYTGSKTDYFYSVGSNISKLTIRVNVADGYDFAIANDKDLKVGVNQVKIYLYESISQNSGKSATARIVADATEANALKVIYLNIYREQAGIAPIWKILFFVLTGLCVLLLIIIILLLIFRPRKQEVQQQQAPIIINTPPAQAQPQAQPKRREPPIIVTTPPQYVQQPPQYVQPPQYIQPPPPQYVQPPQQPNPQPVVQPIIINTGNGEQQRKAPISIDDTQKNLPGNVTIIKNGSDFNDVDGFYDSADPNSK